MNESTFDYVVSFQQRTFPKASTFSKIAKLREEVDELEEAIKSGNVRNVRHEFADCFMLLYGAAYKEGLSYEEINNAINDKMAINEKRDWGAPDNNGVVRHKKKRKIKIPIEVFLLIGYVLMFFLFYKYVVGGEALSMRQRINAVLLFFSPIMMYLFFYIKYEK